MPCFFKDGYQLKTRVIRPVVAPRHILLLALLAVMLYGEWYDLWRQSGSWPSLPPDDPSGSVRVLLVADPQIQGEQNEPGWPLGAVTRWDSDRYLRQGFRRAFDHVLPDVVVFLGDHMDEASIATRPEYQRYTERFWSIFNFPRNARMVAVPGDNDVGGEDEPIQPDKVERHKTVFGKSDSVVVDFLQFFKMGVMQTAISNHTASPLDNGINILLSHFPMTSHVTDATTQSLLRLRANLIFSAHSHKSYIAVREKRSGRVIRMESLLTTGLEHLNLEDEKIVEIVVPTCSYRMGVKKMGYGAAVIDRIGRVRYTILWLPSRYKQLNIYLAVLLCCCVIFFVYLCTSRRSRQKRLAYRAKMPVV